MPKMIYRFIFALGLAVPATVTGNRAVATSAVGDTKGMVMIDGGSSGSKLFSFGTPDHDSERSMKVETQCTVDGAGSLLGAAVLAYDANKCKPKVTVPAETAFGISGYTEELTEAEQYAHILLSSVRYLHQWPCTDGGTVACTRPLNSRAVPMLATAGMRNLPAGENEAVWSNICGVELPGGPGYKFAEKGDQCGTIPGTQEAFYEYLANLAKFGKDIPKQKIMGVFTIGGASAQIALPLLTEPEVGAFRALIESVKGVLDVEGQHCGDMKLKAGEPMPFFNNNGECHLDFVKMVPKSDVPDSLQEYMNEKVQQIGLISFLGLGKSDKFGVAGGVNSIEQWAQDRKCGACKDPDTHKAATCAKDYKYQDCERELQAALDEDIMWHFVTDMFHTQTFSVNLFHFNTPAANPMNLLNAGEWFSSAQRAMTMLKMAHHGVLLGTFAQQVDGMMAVLDEIRHGCVPSGRLVGGFGHRTEGSCMKAYFTMQFGLLPLRSRDMADTPVEIKWNALDWSAGAKVSLETISHEDSGDALMENDCAEEDVGSLANRTHNEVGEHVHFMHGAALYFAHVGY